MSDERARLRERASARGRGRADAPGERDADAVLPLVRHAPVESPSSQAAPWAQGSGLPWSLASLAVQADGPGAPLSGADRDILERSFGADLGGVMIHESEVPRSLGAMALTHGRHVHFAPGVREADGRAGGMILAHEVAHTVQQDATTGGPDAQALPVLDLDVGRERAADEAARQAVHGEPAAPGAPAGAPANAVQLYGGESDYLREVVRGGGAGYPSMLAPLFASDGPNDALMAPKSNPMSDLVNQGVTGAMDWLGYDTRQRPVEQDNDFYRDYAQYMPGYDIDGIPSGAWAQNAATNHVGHGTAPGNPWDNIRQSLVDQEKSMIDSDLATGGTGDLSYWDVYDAHVNAYDSSGGGGNRFIDPGSFALAVYGAPLLEAAGIDSGPITGASIDIFNNPEDTRTEGWAKRMGLAGAEIGGGATLAASGVGQVLSGSPLTGAASIVGGSAMAGLGAFGGAWNTATAVEGGMLGDWSKSLFGP